MKTFFSGRLMHSILAFLMAAGLILPLLGILGLSRDWPVMLAGISAVLLVLSAADLHKTSRLALAVAVPVFAAIYLFIGDGLGLLTETCRALMLELTGVHAALPAYHREAVLLLTLFFSILAWAVTAPASGTVPAYLALLFLLIMIWQFGSGGLLWLILPAIVSALCLSAGSSASPSPLHRTLPVTLIISLLACAVIPSEGMVIPALQEAALDLRQKIMDYLFFTEPRDVFTLASEGYYPYGPGQLGGTAMPSDHPVMIVHTDKTAYLRGSIRNEYNGRTWVDTTGGRRYLWVSPRWAAIRDSVFDAALPAESEAFSFQPAASTLSVRMVSDSTSSMFTPQRVRDLSTGGDLIPYFNIGSEIFATRNLENGDMWSVTAPLMTAGDAGLMDRVLSAPSDPDTYESIRRAYTGLPSHLQASLWNLAREAAGSASTPYEQAVNVMNWLRTNCRYTLEVEALPENVDFVTFFLLRSREGYCTYFATAQTILCRMLGLPARYVEGYLCTPDQSGNAYVTGRNGHAWTEVYFEGFGWLTFDATPASSGGSGGQSRNENPPSAPPPEESADNRDTPSTPSPSPSPEPSPEPTEEPSPEPSIEPEQTPENDVPEDSPAPPSPEPEPEPDSGSPSGNHSLAWLWILLLILLACALLFRIYMTRPDLQARRAHDRTQAYFIHLRCLLEHLTVRGLGRRNAEALTEYARRVDRDGSISISLLPIMETAALILYAHREPMDEETQLLRNAWITLHREMPLPQRFRLLISRVFLPSSRKLPSGWNEDSRHRSRRT